MDTKIAIETLDLYYSEFHALKNINMRIPEKEITAFIGPSGCGKSTLLKSLNRMNDLIEGCRITGRVLLDNDDIYANDDVNLLRKRVGMVFQKPNPFPMSVYDNIAFGPRTHGVKGKAKLDDMVEEALRKAAIWDEVKDRLDKSALSFSGGQQQRLCIARALAVEPEILLMDEPLCNLDVQLRVEMRTEMAFLFRKLGTTVFHVTHDPSEAFAMADRIVIMNKGNIDQIDSPKNCYRNPGTESVAALLGAGNRVHGYAREDGGTQIDLGGSVCGTLGRNGIRKDDMVTVRFRAENTVWTGNERQENSFPVAVEYSSFEGDYYRVMAKMGMGEPLCFLSRNYLEKGTEGYVNVEGDLSLIHISEPTRPY